MRAFLPLLALVAPLGLSAAGLPAPAQPVAVELFTSQGCSSCPPADAYLGELARDPGVVAITRPVTIWDRLGWKDSLASPENTRLQQVYGSKVVRGSGVYTPQIVVGGRFGAVGSDRAEIRRFIGEVAKDQTSAVAVKRGFAGVSGSGSGEVRWLTLSAAVDVAIGRGENGGRKIRYTNVVRDEQLLGQWKGGTQTFPLPQFFAQLPNTRYAIIVQRPNSGAILAASYF
jgi:hypothetical protein